MIGRMGGKIIISNCQNKTQEDQAKKRQEPRSARAPRGPAPAGPGPGDPAAISLASTIAEDPDALYATVAMEYDPADLGNEVKFYVYNAAGDPADPDRPDRPLRALATLLHRMRRRGRHGSPGHGRPPLLRPGGRDRDGG